MSPRYRTRTGVVIDTSPEAAEFLGAEPDDGGTTDAPASVVEGGEPGRIAPPSPEGEAAPQPDTTGRSILEPDPDLPESPLADAERIAPASPEGGPAEPVQAPPPPATEVQEIPEPQQAPEPATAPESEPATQQIQAQPAPPPTSEPAAREGSAEEDAAEPDAESSALVDDDYENWTEAELRAEMRKRNETRDKAERLHVSQNKRDLIDDLRADDQKQ